MEQLFFNNRVVKSTCMHALRSNFKISSANSLAIHPQNNFLAGSSPILSILDVHQQMVSMGEGGEEGGGGVGVGAGRDKNTHRQNDKVQIDRWTERTNEGIQEEKEKKKKGEKRGRNRKMISEYKERKKENEKRLNENKN